MSQNRRVIAILIVFFSLVIYKLFGSEISDNSRSNGCISIDGSEDPHLKKEICNDFIPEIIDTIANRIYLRIEKMENDYIKIKYRHSDSIQGNEIVFKYFSPSEVIFPLTAISYFDSNFDGSSQKTSILYLTEDNVLFLPIIGTNNGLTLYVINLNNGKIIGDDIRTSWTYFWIDINKRVLIRAFTPKYLDDERVKYVVETILFSDSLITSSKFSDIVVDVEQLTEDNPTEQFRIIEEMMENY